MQHELKCDRGFPRPPSGRTSIQLSSPCCTPEPGRVAAASSRGLVVEKASSLGGSGSSHLHSVDQGSLLVTQHILRVEPKAAISSRRAS